MNQCDFRSDTVTQPTDVMRKAMAEAIVGDDVYRDDVTVIELEELAAKLLGKEAAIFVPSGTFGNQLALQVHCQPGDEVLLGEYAHIVQYEAGAAAALGGLQLRCVDAPEGYISPEQIQQRLRPKAGSNVHLPPMKLLAIENAFLGTVLSLQQMEEMSNTAHNAGLKVHLDGARIFNAATSLGCEPHQIANYADTVMCCLSKGLCAPIGSILAGSAEDIERAFFLRKRMGGGLRQVGILAAAGLISLKEMRLRLDEDHQRARYLADLLEQEIPNAKVKREQLDINMVFCAIPNLNATMITQLAAEGILLGSVSHSMLRFVTHNGTPYETIDRMVGRLRNVLVS